MERECVEESCDDGELFEVFDYDHLYQIAQKQMDRCREIFEKIDEFVQRYPQYSYYPENSFSDHRFEDEKDNVRGCFMVINGSFERVEILFLDGIM